MEFEQRIKAYRFVAYSAIAFAGVAVLTVCVTLPMVYSYVHAVRRTMDAQGEFCKVRPLCPLIFFRSLQKTSGER